MHRAAHQLLDFPPILADPLALLVIGREAEAELRAGSVWHGHSSHGLRAFIAARSRLAEDCFVAAMAGGVGQYVLLGAGLDTFAYRAGARNPWLTVFEIDHPATQAWKRARLLEARIAVPDNVVYVPIDFEQGTFLEGLRGARFDFSRPSVFAWLGVTPYLTQKTALETLRSIAETMQPGSEVVFDYAEPVGNHEPSHRIGFTAMAERVASLGEPFRSFFEPVPLARELAAMGFSHIDDFDSEALNKLYFADREDGLMLRGRGHLVKARI